MPRNTLLRIYQSLILPYISYGLTAWGLASKTYLTKVLVLQKRALRFIFSVERCEHAVPLFIHADVLPLNFLYFKSVCCLMHDVQNQKVPNNILNLFSDTASIHSYNTRSSSANKFYIKKSRLEIQKRAFSRVGAKIWNEMPASLKCPCDQKNHFLFFLRFWKWVCLTLDWQNSDLSFLSKGSLLWV